MTEELIEARVEKTSETIVGHKFFLLFVFLLSFLILYPYMQNSIAFRLVGDAITLLSVYAISFRRSLLIVAMALAIPVLLAHLPTLRTDVGTLSIFFKSLAFAFDAFIIVVIFHRVFSRGRPNSETIFGALCIYLLVGFSFANVYWLLVTVQGHAFYLDPVTNLHTIPNRFDFIYYSFGTMTSLGAAGITAVSDQARSLSVIEAILGLLYLAVLIARLMGAYHSSGPRE